MVMPRSRSRSIESSTCSAISRSARPPHIWMKRSARVDLPWSMCAMMEKLRIRLRVVKAGFEPYKERGCPAWSRATLLDQPAILAQLGECLGREAVPAQLGLAPEQDGHVRAVQLVEAGVGVDVDLVELDSEGAQRRRHLLAQMAIAAPEQLNPYP